MNSFKGCQSIIGILKLIIMKEITSSISRD
jgi:hypothetical protein